jgi:hypothetical protein
MTEYFGFSPRENACMGYYVKAINEDKAREIMGFQKDGINGDMIVTDNKEIIPSRIKGFVAVNKYMWGQND